MYCNQCGHEMKDNANFCKKCGSPVDQVNGNISEGKRRIIKFLYTYRKRILIILLCILLLGGIAAGVVFVLPGIMEDYQEQKQEALLPQKAKSVDFKKLYTIEDNRLVLDPLHVTYNDGSIKELFDYDVQIDGAQCKISDGAVKAEELYDGKHLIHLQWKQGEKNYEYEATVDMEHKKDTWGKFVNLVGMTGREIAAEYGPLGTPEYGSFKDGDWGYGYVDISALSVQARFPAAIFNKPEDYSDSDVQCVEMAAPLNTFFYNMKSEMSRKELAKILNITLTDTEGGGCIGTMSDGKLLYIGTGAVQDDVYTPDTTAWVTVDEEEKSQFFERLF